MVFPQQSEFRRTFLQAYRPQRNASTDSAGYRIVKRKECILWFMKRRRTAAGPEEYTDDNQPERSHTNLALKDVTTLFDVYELILLYKKSIAAAGSNAFDRRFTCLKFKHRLLHKRNLKRKFFKWW
jgi:hypothetical protein